MFINNNNFSQEDLTAINSSFFNYLEKDNSSLHELFRFSSTNEAKELRSGLQALPTFISKNNVLELEKSLVAVTKLLREIPKRLQNYDETILRKYHNLEKEEFDLHYKDSIRRS